MIDRSIENERENGRKSYGTGRETRKSIRINSTGNTTNYGTAHGSEGFNVYGASAKQQTKTEKGPYFVCHHHCNYPLQRLHNPRDI